ncbi:MAG: YicC family protein [SAR324 cluster bacterium]|nr:YicC family protein [SAR324 cluster bacterium]
MAVSMTGFGSGKIHRENWQCSAEIRTVNNRFLDINIRLPTGFQRLLQPLKQIVQKTCFRGKVDCTIVLSDDAANNSLCLNHDLAEKYKNLIGEFHSLTQLPVTINLSDLLKIQDLIQIPQPDPESDFFASLIEDSLLIAIDQLKSMRVKEGESLMIDIRERLNISTSILNEIEQIAKDLPPLYYQKLRERLAALDGKLEFDEERVHQELALFADRSDITEEITRFRTHLEHMESVLEEKEVGRRADFLLQEFNREINTIASKSNNAAISQLVVEIKGQLEKMREQIQNIE